MRITMEHYRDFIGTLAHKRAEWHTELMALEHALQRGELDECDMFEYENASQNEDFYANIQKYFLETDRWAEFDSLETLKAYVDKISKAYKALDAYSDAVLPVDVQDTVGVSDEEWNRLEDMRWNLKKAEIAWSSFAEFCEYGEIL